MMSTEHNSNQFLTQEFVTEQKGISTIKFTNEVLRIVKASNRAVVLSLVKVKDDIILDGTRFFPDAQDVAMLYFDSEYERLILKTIEESKVTFMKYKEMRDALIAAIRAQPEESKRTKPVTTSCAHSSTLLASIPGITDKDQNILDS